MSTAVISPWAAALTRLSEAEAVVEAYKITTARVLADLEASRLDGRPESETRALECRLAAANIQVWEAIQAHGRAHARFTREDDKRVRPRWCRRAS